MTPRQEVWKSAVKGHEGLCSLGLRVAARFSLLLGMWGAGLHGRMCSLGWWSFLMALSAL